MGDIKFVRHEFRPFVFIKKLDNKRAKVIPKWLNVNPEYVTLHSTFSLSSAIFIHDVRRPSMTDSSSVSYTRFSARSAKKQFISGP